MIKAYYIWQFAAQTVKHYIGVLILDIGFLVLLCSILIGSEEIYLIFLRES